MISRIVGLDTASEIWSTLDWIYVATSKSRLLELRTEIQSLKKDGLTVDEYVLKLKTLVDKLSSIGEPVSNRDQLINLFQGLGAEYNSFVTSINSRVDLPTVEEVHSLLLSYDLRLQTQNTPVSDHLNLVQANMTTFFSQQEKSEISSKSFPAPFTYIHTRKFPIPAIHFPTKSSWKTTKPGAPTKMAI